MGLCHLLMFYLILPLLLNTPAPPLPSSSLKSPPPTCHRACTSAIPLTRKDLSQLLLARVTFLRSQPKCHLFHEAWLGPFVCTHTFHDPLLWTSSLFCLLFESPTGDKRPFYSEPQPLWPPQGLAWIEPSTNT